MEREWPEIGLRISDVGNGVLIEQAGRIYRARKWRLTDEVVGIVDCALRHGLKALWVEGHPSDAYFEGGARFHVGIHHITFARRHNENWIFVLGGEANPPGVEKITFNKKCFHFVHGTGIPYKWAHFGGKHVFVAPEDLESVLLKLSDETIDAIEAASRIPSRRAELLPKTGVTSEEQLELALVQHLRTKPDGTFRFIEVRQRYDGLIPDILIDVSPETFLVIELKLSRASRAELDQLLTYMELKALRARASKASVKGVLIARSYGEEIVERVSGSETGVSLYAYGFEDAVTLKLVAGNPIIEDLQLYP